MRIHPIALCLGLAVTPSLALTAHAQYDVTILQGVDGGSSQASAINASGQSVGSSYTGSGYDAVLWSPSGKPTVLQDAGGQGNSYAVAINASGWSVGESDTARGQDAVLWSPSRGCPADDGAGRHPIDVIARETGFADRDHMRRAFLRAFGRPPQAIRRNARGSGGLNYRRSHSTPMAYIRRNPDLGRVQMSKTLIRRQRRNDGKRRWADCGPTRVAAGRTGVPAIAAVGSTRQRTISVKWRCGRGTFQPRAP